MGSSPLTLMLALASASGALAASGSGKTTRYWDCCKPSCAWTGKASVSAPVTTCDKNDNPLTNPAIKSGCDGGTAFSCSNQAPWAVNDQFSYGFAATAITGGTESSWCCACYAITFTSGPVAGKSMVVQSTNTGGDLGANHFDLQIPGGGVGIFDGCTPQFGGLPGERYGGISSRSQCDSFPSFLKAGCYWRFDWFLNADNPDITFTQVQCPSALTARSGCKRSDDSSFPVYNVPTGGSGTTTSRATSTRTTTSAGSTGSSSALYGQCGGIGWTGPTTCVSGAVCKFVNDWYSQCLPA